MDRSVSVPRVWVPVQAAEGFILCNGALTKLQAAFACHIADMESQMHARKPAAKLLYVLVRSQGCLADADVVGAIRGNAFGRVLHQVQPPIQRCHNESKNAFVAGSQAWQEINVELRGLSALLDQALALPGLFLWPANTRLRADEVLGLFGRGSMHVVNGRSKRGDCGSVHLERRRDDTAEGQHTRAETAARHTENARRADIANKVRSDTRTATCAGMRAQPHRAMAQHQEAVMCVWFRSGRRKTERRKASAN